MFGDSGARVRELRVYTLFGLLTVLAGCYLVDAARGQLSLNARRLDIDTLIGSPATDPATRRRLERVREIRAFASRELALPDNRSYRSYVELGSPYVVWNVVATREFSVAARTWCFPVAGCVAYRGYFDAVKAEGYAYGLRQAGFDTLVYGVPAYSTLGHFADPVLSSMLAYGEDELAAMLFHELAHQLLYVPGDSAFDEGFASLVEEEGLRRWLAREERPQALSALAARRAREERIAGLIAASRERLAAIYAGGGEPAALRAAKAAEFARLRADYIRARAELGPGYEWLFAPDMNNASLLVLATYRECLPGFRELLAKAAGDLPAFYGLAREIAKRDAPGRHRALCGAAASAAESG
jgi:predicted aminopeptidase